MKITSCIEMLELSTNVMGQPSLIHPTLLHEGDSVALIDVGYPGMLPAIRKAAEEAGASLDNLNTIIMTHHDIDHMGGLGEVLAAYKGQPQVFAYEDEADYISGKKRPLKLVQREANLEALSPEQREMIEKMALAFQKAFSPVDRTLSDGETLPLCGGVTVIHTPGHTHGHICLYFPQSKTLVAGDALSVKDGVLARTSNTINHDSEEYVQSLKKLTAFDIEAVLCYHGGLYDAGDASRRIAELAKE